MLTGTRRQVERQHRRAEHPRLGAEARRDDPHVGRATIGSARARDDLARRREQQLAGGDRAAADHDDLGVEDVDERRRCRAPRRSAHRASITSRGGGVAVVGELGDERARDLAPGRQRAPERRVGRLARDPQPLARRARARTRAPPGSRGSGSCPGTAARRRRRRCGRARPAAPRAPRTSRPSTRSPPPMPVPSVSMTASRAPRAAPQRHSASIAALASLSTTTGSPRRSASRSRNGDAASGRWLESSATPVAGSTRHGIAEPDREDLAGRRLARPPAPPRRAGRCSAPASSGRGQAVGAVVHLELRVDRPGEQLRPSQVDADHAAGGHVGHHTSLMADPHGRPPSTSSTARVRAFRGAAATTDRCSTSCASAPPGASAEAQAASPSAAWSSGCVLALVGVGRPVARSSSSSPRRSTRTQVLGRRAGPARPAAASGSCKPQTTLVLGSDQRTRGTKEPGASTSAARAAATRSCSCAPAAGTAPSCRSRATPSSTSPATGATRSTPPTRSAAPRSRSRRSSSTSASTIDHVFEVNFDELPRPRRRDGRDRLHRRLRRLAHQRRLQERRLHAAPAPRARRTSTASRRSRSRARATTCATPSEDDLTRARRQQKIISAMKSRVFSPAGFVRLPFISWNAPEDAEDRHARPGAAGLRDRHGAQRQRARPRSSSPRAA